MSERIPAEVFRPGEYIADELDARTWSVETLAAMSGIEASILTEVIERGYPVTDQIAAGLSRAFGTSAVYWINLDRAWQGWAPAKNAKGEKGKRR